MTLGVRFPPDPLASKMTITALRSAISLALARFSDAKKYAYARFEIGPKYAVRRA